MEDISVLGLGNWGTALANHLALKGYQVLGWSIEAPIVEGVNSSNKNPIFQSQIELSPNLRATGSFEEALRNLTIVMAIPSQALSDVVPQMKLQDGSLVISAIKGIEASSVLTPLQYFAKYFKDEVKTSVISGPSFAKDIIAQQPAGVVAASSSETAARQVAELFSSERMKVYISTDPLGVELGGILKNVIALAVGVCDGIDLGDSARAGLITRGLAEMMRLSEAMGAQVQTLSGLSGLGDLVMTATCDTSRNRTVGLRLGKGESLSHIIDTLGSVAEGVKTTPLVLKLAKKHGIDMPITEGIAALLKGEIGTEEMVAKLISRPMKREF